MQGNTKVDGHNYEIVSAREMEICM